MIASGAGPRAVTTAPRGCRGVQLPPRGQLLEAESRAVMLRVQVIGRGLQQRSASQPRPRDTKGTCGVGRRGVLAPRGRVVTGRAAS